MKRLLFLFILLLAGIKAHAAQCGTTLTSPSQSVLQSAINSCGSGNFVQLAAGTTTIASTMTLACGVVIQGPTAFPATAKVTTSTANISLFFANNCTGSAQTGFKYLDLDGAGAFVTGGASFSNFVFQNNQTTNVPSEYCGPGCNQPCVSCQSVWFNFNSGVTLSNLDIENNNFGYNNTSCAATAGPLPVSSISSDDFPGNCDGVRINSSAPGQVQNLIIRYNTFTRIEEAFHFANVNYSSGAATSYCNGCYIEYNYTYLIRRIQYEYQGQILNSALHFRWNVLGPPNNSQPNTGGYAFSLPCCQFGANFGTTTNTYLDVSNNIIFDNNSTSSSNHGISWGAEAWGYGPTVYENNLIQGYVCSGLVWGYVTSATQFSNNTMQGAIMANTPGSSCVFAGGGGGAFIAKEFSASQAPGAQTPPTQSGNVTGTTPAAITSVAPIIAPAPGVVSFPLTVTLTDAGYTSGAQPLGNTGIWYTTDGSTPVPGTGTAKYLATGSTFTLASAGTVKAVGMWGATNQPTSYPSGFGFTPSAVISATYTASSSGFYISPTGNDGNPGTLALPWLTPNHNLNCGTVITAISGTYSAANFQTGHWGTITCPTQTDVAWLICQTFDTCKISSSSTDGMWVDKSFWGVSGWEITVTAGTNGACFHAGPNTNTSVNHVIFTNNVANSCKGGGFTAYDHSTTGSVDYIAYLGNVAYNSASGTGACYSGLNIYQPIASDTNSGTHMYIAGNFSYSNIDGNNCFSSGGTTDGEGIILDTFDFDQAAGTPYTQRAVVHNNIEGFNGGRGIEAANNAVGSAQAAIYIDHNTMVGSGLDPHSAFPLGLAELAIINAFNVNESNNLVYTVHQFTIGSDNYYALGVTQGNGTDVVATNYAAGIAGNNTYLQSSPGFVYGTNTLGTNPAFASTVAPGAPNCTGQTNVATCMAGLVANLTPSASGASAYGYQTPSNVSISDPLFPTWLCTATGTLNPNIPQGLITPGCGGAAAPALTSCFQGNTGGVNMLTVGGASTQQQGFCSYASVPATYQCYPVPDVYGNTITAFGTRNSAILAVTTGGLASGVSAGSANATATATGNMPCSDWTFNVSSAPNSSTFNCTGGCKVTGTFTITP